LRERLVDLDALARHFLGQHSTHTKSLAPDALKVLQDYAWPGNVRELKRVCEQLLLLAPLPIVRAQDVHSVLPKQIEMPTSATGSKADLSKGLASLLSEFEATILKQALAQVAEVDEAARLLGVSRSTFYKKLKDHHIEWRPS
jgi:DNA-binding NtrC family response regulator